MDSIKFGWIRDLGVVEFEMPEQTQRQNEHERLLMNYYTLLGRHRGINALDLKEKCETFIKGDEEDGYYLGSMGDVKIYVNSQDWKLTIQDDDDMVYNRPNVSFETFVYHCIEFYE